MSRLRGAVQCNYSNCKIMFHSEEGFVTLMLLYSRPLLIAVALSLNYMHEPAGLALLQ